MSFGEFQILFVLIILFLRLALSNRSTPKGTGAFLEIQKSYVLIVLLIISLPITIVIAKGTAPWGIEDCFCNLYYLAYIFYLLFLEF